MEVNENDLFADLRSLDLSDVNSKLLHQEGLLEDIDGRLTKNRNITSYRSACIMFCLGKSDAAPPKNSKLGEELAELTVVKRIEFNQLIQQRDALMGKIVLPKYRIIQRMASVYEKLTHSSQSAPLTLGQEITLFSEFFELQAMHAQLDPLATVEIELEHLHKEVSEHVKTINKADRDTAKIISALVEQRRQTTREIGRLKAFIRSRKPKTKPADAGNARKKISQGDTISMEDLGALLDHGGLTDIEPIKEPSQKKKKKSAFTSTKAKRNRRKT